MGREEGEEGEEMETEKKACRKIQRLGGRNAREMGCRFKRRRKVSGATSSTMFPGEQHVLTECFQSISHLLLF